MGTNDNKSLPHGYVLQGEKNRYVIEEVLGQGSFGITYLAKFKSQLKGAMGSGYIQATVAVKEFFMRDMNTRDSSTGYLNDASQDSLIGKYRRAFVREAHNLANLTHPGIVNVFEVIETNNTVYIVMEYIDGGSLDELISSRGSLPEKEALQLFREICLAVDSMHQHRMLHLDIKPKNIMMDEDGHTRLIDFGLSKQYTADGEPESSTSIGLGTPGYAPIEQAERTDNDTSFRPTIDIYALGGTLYKMLTGSTPPVASKVSESALEGENIITTALSGRGITDAVTSLVSKAMWPSSRKRHQSAAELISAIDGLLDGSTTEDTVLEEPKSKPASGESPNQQPRPQPKLAPKPNSKPQPEPAPKQASKPVKGMLTGFPKWLYGVVAALIVGLIAFLIIPKSKQGKEPPEPDKPVQEQTITTTPTPKPEPEPEPEPEPKVVAVTSISLSKTSLTLDEGATSTLTVKYTPTDATDKSTTWKSTDTKVATVNSNGKVTAIKAGSATIIASCGGHESYCNLTVTSKTIASFEDNVEWVDLDEYDVVEVEPEPEEDKVFMVVEDAPEFPGGTNALYDYLKKNIQYPAICKENGITGRVIVSFTVNKDGSIVDVEVEKGVHPQMDKEAVRVVNSMPKWKPGSQRGKPVRCRYNLPVNFRLN